MAVLTQFIFRLSFGLSLAMALTPSRLVTSGYYRNNLYVLLGINVLATLVQIPTRTEQVSHQWVAATAAILSYAGSVAWLYEKPRAGVLLLAMLSGTSLCGAWLLPTFLPADNLFQQILVGLDPVGGGLVVGVTMGAMLLGHWYLNSPGMRLEPLQRLIRLLLAALAFRAVISLIGLSSEWGGEGLFPPDQWLLIGLRWLAGILGTALLAAMAWRTLQVPNTQSATGILYVAVITTFLGELTAPLLSTGMHYPV